MPRVAVEDHAFRDPRIGALAADTPLKRVEVALCRLLELWSHVTKTQRPVQPRRVVGFSLGLKRAEHVHVLVEVGLAVEADDGRLDLSPMSDLFGDWEWYGEERARSGGRARAAEAEREGGRFQAKCDWGAELLQALGDGQPRHVAELAESFGVQRRTIREQLRKLGTEVEHMGDGLWRCAGPAQAPAHGDALEPAPASALDQRTSSATSALAPSLALPPVLSSERERAPARADMPAHEPAQNEALEPSHTPSPSPSQEQRRDAAWRLAQYHDQVGQRVASTLGKGWRSQGTAGPQEWARMLLSGATEEECQHVLEVLAAEADERGVLGLADPLRFLRTPTSTEIWKRASALPDEEAAREATRASPDARGIQRLPAEPTRKLKRVG